LDRVILRKRYISLHEAREALEPRIKSQARKEEVHERTWSYLALFGSKSGEEARRAFESLKKLGLRDETAVNLLNICPESEGEVRSILVMERESVYDPELVSNILAILRKFCSS